MVGFLKWIYDANWSTVNHSSVVGIVVGEGVYSESAFTTAFSTTVFNSFSESNASAIFWGFPCFRIKEAQKKGPKGAIL
jgi:hypothetical protein